MYHRTALIASVVAMALVVAAAPAELRAEITNINVQVDGLSCPFCVYNLEKKLKRVNGVRDIDISLETGNVKMHLQQGNVPSFRNVRGAVEQAGFTPGEISLTVVGALSIADGKVFLVSRDVDEPKEESQKYLLHERGREKDYFKEKTQRRLEELASEGRPVAVTGGLHEHAEGPTALSVDAIKVLPQADEKKGAPGE